MVSAVGSVAGAAMTASAANAQASSEEAIANWNADRQREKANQARGEAGVQSYRVAREVQQNAARARAGMYGLATDRGSPSMVGNFFALEEFEKTQDQWYKGETQFADLKNKEAVTRWEGKVRADNTRSQGRASLLSGIAGAVGGLAKGIKGGGGMSDVG